MNYKLIANRFGAERVLRLDDGAFIPVAPGNRDYREYLEWLAEGNVPEPADPLLPEPSEEEQAASQLQALGLTPATLLDMVAKAKEQRDAGLYPMLDADGKQIFANGIWQWVPEAKKDWVFDATGQRVNPQA